MKQLDYNRALRCACCLASDNFDNNIYIVQFLSNAFDIAIEYVARDLASVFKKYQEHRASGGGIKEFEDNEAVSP